MLRGQMFYRGFLLPFHPLIAMEEQLAWVALGHHLSMMAVCFGWLLGFCNRATFMVLLGKGQVIL